MSKEWETRRTNLNHDWLKNDFLRRLRAFVLRVEDGAKDTERLEEFIHKHWPEWRRHSQSIQELLVDAEDLLSPRQYFASHPLSSCPAMVNNWLPSLIHALWLARTNIRQRKTQAQSALDEANALFDELSPVLLSSSQGGVQNLAQSVYKLKAFEAAAMQLGESVGQFPHHVEAV